MARIGFIDAKADTLNAARTRLMLRLRSLLSDDDEEARAVMTMLEDFVQSMITYHSGYR